MRRGEQMAVKTVVLLVAIVMCGWLAFPTSAKELMRLPSGLTVFVSVYRDGVFRVKLQPTTGEFYHVTDVVVAEKVPDQRITPKCDGTVTQTASQSLPVAGSGSGETCGNSASDQGEKTCGQQPQGGNNSPSISDPNDYSAAKRCYIDSQDGPNIIVEQQGEGDSIVVSIEYRDASNRTISYHRIPAAKVDAPEITSVFPGAPKLYGLPQHATDVTLKRDVTYQLYNLDVFHYKLDDPGGIYGSIPFLMAHSETSTSGALFLNSAEMNVRILRDDETPNPGDSGANWKAEVGIVDFFLFPGPTPKSVHKQHAHITGHAYFPPMFALGYHQCRWNYRSSDDCLDVDAGFDKFNIPYDVLWLDIEHTDGKKYFTWDIHNFPEPKKLIDTIAAKGRKMVTIKDPHIKRESGYHVHDEASSKGFYVKTESGSDYEGHCWPGTSSWIDFYNKDARDWYATLFTHDRYGGSTPDLYTWIDMNEPSVFNSHQVTMDRNAVHRSAAGKQVKHRYLHNMYGFYHTMAAYEGHLLTSKPSTTVKRPFILTRSFFSGSQRYSAMWTGDNMAKWDHLEKSIPMLLSLSIANFPFVGADCGGFFFNPEADLMVRWYQAGIFYPFFRGHAHLETKRREPWLFGEEATAQIRRAIALRYTLLPYLYTTFFLAHATGDTVIRPLFYEFPNEPSLFDEQNTYMFGPSLLVSPVVKQGEWMHAVHLPRGARWYDHFTGKEASSGLVQLPVTMDSIPLYHRGGSIVPAKNRLRRSSAAMIRDPLTLYVALDENSSAVGDIYLDDEDTLNYQSGAFLRRRLVFVNNHLTATAPLSSDFTPASQNLVFEGHVEVERIVIFGLASRPRRAATVTFPHQQHETTGDASQFIAQGRELTFTTSDEALVIRQPKVFIDSDFSIVLEY